jgi:hypothetical protein
MSRTQQYDSDLQGSGILPPRLHLAGKCDILYQRKRRKKAAMSIGIIHNRFDRKGLVQASELFSSFLRAVRTIAIKLTTLILG